MQVNSKKYFDQITFLFIFALFFFITSQTVFAEAAKEVTREKGLEKTQTSDQTDETLDKALAGIERQRKTIHEIQVRIEGSQGAKQQMLEAWLDKARINLLEQGVAFAKKVEAKTGDEDINKEGYRREAEKIVNEQNRLANTVVNSIQKKLKQPEPDSSAAEKAGVFSKTFVQLESIQHVVQIQIKNLELAENFKLEVAEHKQSLKKSLSDRAVGISILLDSMMDDIASFTASAEVLPDDEQIATSLNVTKQLAKKLAESLDSQLDIMNSLGMETVAYRELVLRATGEITTDVLGRGVATRLFAAWGKKLWNGVVDNGPDIFFKLFIFIIILYASKKLSKLAHRIVEKSLNKSNVNLSELLRRMILSITRNSIIVIGLLVALSQVGIRIGPLFAGLGIVGFVVGFALQDSLSNFASGLMILLYRPYDVGSLIEAGGVFGTVSKMSLVNTTVMTFDNQTIVMPNNKIWGDVIKNVTAQKTRRVDMVFGISYTDDIPKAETIFKEILDSHGKVLKDPEPIVRLHELADSSVNFIVRPWVATGDYWDVYWDITRTVKLRFDSEGISIPFPQRDVHIYNHSITS
jgi:small conductance mechanosensitive channel